MDRINLKRIALTTIALVTTLLFSACPLADPLELREVVEERVAATSKVGTPQISITQEATGITESAVFDIGSTVALTSKDIIFTISNPGTAPLYMTGAPLVAITGTNQSEFSIQLSPASPISVNGTSTFALRFSPTTAGAKSITLTLTNSSAASSFSFTVIATATPQDLQAPTGTLAISGGSAYTNSINTSLTISAADTGGGSLSQMMIANESSFSGMSWEPYATSRVWSVPAGDAVKTVYIRFKDNSGNISPIYSDTITLDTVAPTVTARPIVNNSINVVRSSTTLTYTFSEAMNSATINTTTAKLVTKAGSGIVTAVITKPDSTHVTFTLNSPGFYFGRNYALELLTGITDLAGNALTPERIDFTIENDIFENTGIGGAPTGNGYPNNPYFLWTSEVDTPHMISGQLNSQDYGGYLARTQAIGGTSDQDRYSLYIDCAQSDSITLHVFTTDVFGTPTGVLAAGQGIKFVLYNPASSPVLISSNDYNLLKNDQTGTWTIPYGTESDYYTLVIFGDDSGRYYDFSWSEDYNGI